eukprot:TRINITY_DN13734_c0_g1_i3.p1 TRINITY_DN13734_c0_g1~~TRINITY_DN13734_c0_g1_i3.p1  ORF type:complete len:343 (-),score=130.50 TRINITY_DN13734_c0_g1_i3:147-1037(-)
MATSTAATATSIAATKPNQAFSAAKPVQNVSPAGADLGRKGVEAALHVIQTLRSELEEEKDVANKLRVSSAAVHELQEEKRRLQQELKEKSAQTNEAATEAAAVAKLESSAAAAAEESLAEATVALADARAAASQLEDQAAKLQAVSDADQSSLRDLRQLLEEEQMKQTQQQRLFEHECSEFSDLKASLLSEEKAQAEKAEAEKLASQAQAAKEVTAAKAEVAAYQANMKRESCKLEHFMCNAVAEFSRRLASCELSEQQGAGISESSETVTAAGDVQEEDFWSLLNSSSANSNSS